MSIIVDRLKYLFREGKDYNHEREEVLKSPVSQGSRSASTSDHGETYDGDPSSASTQKTLAWASNSQISSLFPDATVSPSCTHADKGNRVATIELSVMAQDADGGR